MARELVQPESSNIDVEIGQLTYYAYLLTLNPDVASSVVMAAVDSSDSLASRHYLVHRTVAISLAQLRQDASAPSDTESLSVEALLYGDASCATATLIQCLKEQTNSNPILLLDSEARIAFILHHV